MGRDTHLDFLRKNNRLIKLPQFREIFFTIPGDLEITRHFWRLPEIPGDLAGLNVSNVGGDPVTQLIVKGKLELARLSLINIHV